MADETFTRRVVVDGEEQTVKLRRIRPEELRKRRIEERAAMQKAAAKTTTKGKTETK
jgi:hypothetical protein